MLPNIKTAFKKYLHALHSDQQMLQIFLENTINMIHKRKKNFDQPLSSSLIPKVIKENNSLIEKLAKYVIFVKLL